MMGRRNRAYNPSAIEQAAKRNWNEAWATYRTQRNAMFAVTILALCLAGGAFVHSWYHDTQPKMIPYVVDRNGPSLLTAQLEAHIPDAARIKGHLVTWVQALRTVTSDPIVQKHLVDETYSWTDTDSVGIQQLNEWYTHNNPFIRIKEYTVDVDLTSVVSQGGEGWLVDWSETAYPKQVGQPIVTTYWRMTLIAHIRLPETDDEFRANWDGVFVMSFHITQLPGMKTS